MVFVEATLRRYELMRQIDECSSGIRIGSHGCGVKLKIWSPGVLPRDVM